MQTDQTMLDANYDKTWSFMRTTPSSSSFSSSLSSCSSAFSFHSCVASDLPLFNKLFKYLLSENGGSGSQRSSFSAEFCKTIYTYIDINTHSYIVVEKWQSSRGVCCWLWRVSQLSSLIYTYNNEVPWGSVWTSVVSIYFFQCKHAKYILSKSH